MSSFLGRSRALSREWWYSQKKSDVNSSKAALTGDPQVNLHVVKKTFTHADLTEAAVSETLAVATLPAGAEVVFAFADVNALFSGGVATAVALEVGSAADPDLWYTVPTGTLFTGGDLGRTFGTQGAGATGDGAVVKAKFTATGDDVADLDAGSVTVFLVYTVV